MIIETTTNHFYHDVANHDTKVEGHSWVISNIGVSTNQYQAKHLQVLARLGEIIIMLFKKFLEENITDLEIPFQPDERRKYPTEVWENLHKSVVVNHLQHYRRADTIRSLVNKIVAGDDLGGITIDNIVDMWMEGMSDVATQIVGVALSNPNIKKLYNDLITKKEVECNDWHGEDQHELVKQGVEIPQHTHEVEYIEVTDENREQFNEFVDVVLRHFDSNTYGELPEKYSTAGQRDVDEIVDELKQVIDDGTDISSFLKQLSPPDNSGDFV